MKRLILEVIMLSLPMVVSTSMDISVETQWQCENCSLYVNRRAFQIDLICLPLKKFDMVLGIDWVSANPMYIGCKEKVIFITTDGATLNDVITLC